MRQCRGSLHYSFPGSFFMQCLIKDKKNQTRTSTHTLHSSEVVGQSMSRQSVPRMRQVVLAMSENLQSQSLCFLQRTWCRGHLKIPHNVKTPLHSFICQLQCSLQHWEASTCQNILTIGNGNTAVN